MQLTGLLLLSFVACVAMEYVLNDLERGAIDCIRYRYDDYGTDKAGKLQIDCQGNLWIEARSMTGSWNRLPPFRVRSKCDPSNPEKPFFLNELVHCAKQLLNAHCGKETTATVKDKNIQELIETLSPKQKTCEPLHVLTKLEEAALDCIRHSFSSVRAEKGRVGLYCRSQQFYVLRVFFIHTSGWTDVQLKAGGDICKSSMYALAEEIRRPQCRPIKKLEFAKTNGINFGKRAVECAKRLLDEFCVKGNVLLGDGDIAAGSLGEFIEKVRPKESAVCQSEV